MLEKGGPPDAKTVHHLDRCLSCLSCMTTCAVKVDYAHLIDIARDYIEDNYRRPLGERMLRRLIAELLPYPRRFALALRLARLAGPFAGILPPRLRNLVGLAVARPSAGEILAPAIHPAEGTRRARVALLPSCAQQALDRNINAATIRLLQRHGCEVVIAPGVGCCGALPLHMGRSDAGQGAGARATSPPGALNWRTALDAVVVNASGCGTTVKDYGHFVGGEDARRIGALDARCHRTSGAAWSCKPGGAEPYRVAYHDACSLQHGQRVTSAAAPASGARRLRGPRRAGAAFLLRLGRHLQSAAAGDRDGARRTQSRAYRKRRPGHHRRRQSRLHGADRPLRSICRSCTRSSCWTGRPAGRCRPPCAAGRCASQRRAAARGALARSDVHRRADPNPTGIW